MMEKDQSAPHPGEVLGSFLKERGMSSLSLALAINIHPPRLTELIRGRRGMTADTAIKLSGYADFNTTPQFWMNLQSEYELWDCMRYRRNK
jgi:addiction module HigA family antidote